MTDNRVRIYTRAGDSGTTGLVGGVRVKKNDLRIETCGTLDEVNSMLGVVRSLLPLEHEIVSVLAMLQNDLFTVCAEIAALTENGTHVGIPHVREEHVLHLEQTIDYFDNQLPAQHSFILPVGTPAAAFLHLSRTVCRRAERALVSLAEQHKYRPELLVYVNRLSDLLYVLARFVNMKEGQKEQAPAYTIIPKNMQKGT